MTHDDIIRIAREADGHKGDQCEVCGTTHGLWMFGGEELEDFAAFVAAAEREACAKAVEVFDKTFQTGGVIAHAIRARIK